MSLSHAFRLSFYSSLGISCLILFYGEWDFLPWACALFPILLGMMAYAYLREGREYLNEEITNRIGTFIGLATIGWVVYKIPRTEQDLISGGVPWPAALVPLLAPLLPILMLVKLYRPKTLADFWVFQLIALVNVTLACILAGEMYFFLLLAVFLLSQLWCMTLFFLYRQRVYKDDPEVDPRRFPLFGKREAVDPAPTPLRHLGLWRALRWGLPVLFLGLSVFFMMPRFSDSQWVPNKLSAAGQTTVVKTGGGGTGIDVAREGTLEISEEPAFEVKVFDHRGRPASLPINQHWRTKVYDSYEHGHWKSWERSFRFRRQPLPSEEHLVDNWNHPRSPEDPPGHLTDSQVYVYFQVESSDKVDVPLADPIASGGQVGMYPHFGNKPSKNPFFRRDAEAEVYLSKNFKNVMRYGQILAPSLRGSQIPSLNTISERYYHQLIAPFGTGANESPLVIQKFARDLLGEIPGLAKGDRVMDEMTPLNSSQYARIAKALCRYLAESGVYSYSLRQRRSDTSIDPTVDFLINVKEGHCERYAAGLTLMLRSLRIPARIVRGYRGYDRIDEGHFVVRQNMAHAWTEALVPGPQAGTFVWLELDPTPDTGQAEDSVMPVVMWMWARVSNPQFLWKNMIMDYNQDRQNEARGQFRLAWDRLTAKGKEGSAREVESSANWTWPALILGMLAAAGFGYWGRRIWRRNGKRSAAPPPVDFYTQLLRVLARKCQLEPAPGQTPLEFGRQASRVLAHGGRPEATPLPARLRDLPVEAARLLYRMRYSGKQALPEECAALQNGVAELAAALA